jgi:hypothetical protein
VRDPVTTGLEVDAEWLTREFEIVLSSFFTLPNPGGNGGCGSGHFGEFLCYLFVFK